MIVYTNDSERIAHWESSADRQYTKTGINYGTAATVSGDSPLNS